MAKDVVFESERYEKRQALLRWLIPVAVVLVLIVIAVVVALIVRGGRGKPMTGGEGTAYPYTWTENRNGSVSLEIDRAAAPGFVWTESGSGGPVNVVTEQDTANGKTRFTLTPKTTGRTVLLFTLHREEDESDRIFELSALTDVSDTGKLLKTSLLSIGGKPLFGAVTGGEDGLYPYSIRMDEAGDLMIAILLPPLPEDSEEETGDKDGGWSCVSDNEAVAAVLGVIAGEELAVAYLRPGSTPGTTGVQMTDSVSGTVFTAEFALAEDGSISLLSHAIRSGAGPAGTTD